MKVSEQTVASDVLRAYAAIIEKNPDKKYELIHNEIIEMAGGSFNHAKISAMLLHLLSGRLNLNFYAILGPDAGVMLPNTAGYVFPDVSVVAGTPRIEKLEGLEFIGNPCLVAETLSPSTMARDHNEKRAAYQQIPTLQTYLLAAQDAPRVERYERADDTWRYDVFEGLDAAFSVLDVAAELRLADLYRGVNFGNV